MGSNYSGLFHWHWNNRIIVSVPVEGMNWIDWWQTAAKTRQSGEKFVHNSWGELYTYTHVYCWMYACAHVCGIKWNVVRLPLGAGFTPWRHKSPGYWVSQIDWDLQYQTITPPCIHKNISTITKMDRNYHNKFYREIKLFSLPIVMLFTSY